MNDRNHTQLLACLDDPTLVDRLKAGISMVVFNWSLAVNGTNGLHDVASERVNHLRATIPSLRVARLRTQPESLHGDQGRRLWDFLDGQEPNVPRVLFVDVSQDALERCNSSALSTADEKRAVLLSDAIVSRILKNAIVVRDPFSAPTLSEVASLPMTVIEEALLKAMKADGLEVTPQVSFPPYVVDFVVGAPAIRLAVEADGAAFHDPARDAERDQHLRELYDLSVLRFSGSRIMRDPSGCIQRIRAAVSEHQARNELYPYEGLNDLDDSQRIAVEHSVGHARVLAPAGSGKTKVLINRVVHLLNSGCAPAAILVLAFNKKAATQLEDRLRALSIPVGRGPRDGGVWIATLNSFGYRVLQNEGQKFEIIGSAPKERKLVSDALKAIGIDLLPVRGDDPLATITQEVARIRRGLVNPVDTVVEVTQPGGKRPIAISAIWQSVRTLQEKRRALTFDDQIFLTSDLLLREATVRHDWQSRFEHVLVDEYQDLNSAQILLLQLITGGTACIFAVGDDDQGIYSWRDASSVNLLKDFEASYHKTTTFTLNVNYRCPKVVVRCGQRLIQRNKKRFPKKVISAPLAPVGRLEISSAQGLAALGKSAAAFLKECRTSNNCSWGEMAVLSRTNVQLLAAAVALDRAGIPRGPLPHIRLFSTQAGQRLTSYLSLCQAPSNVLGQELAAIINRPNRFVGRDVEERFRTAQDPWLLLNLLAYGCPGDRQANSQLKDLISQVCRVRRLTRQAGVRSVDILDAVLSHFSFASKIDPNARESDDATDEMVLHVIRECARDFDDVIDFLHYAKDQVKKEVEGDPDGSQNESGGDRTEVLDCVTLSTMHGAKGREWPAVCLFDASLPPGKVLTLTEEEEERRVFYVGITRASKMLHVSFTPGRASPFVGEAFVPSNCHRESDTNVTAWRQLQLGEVARLQRSIDDTKQKLSDLEAEEAELDSGRGYIKLKHDLEMATERCGKLQDQFIELGKKRPTGLVARLFRGGISAEQLVAEKATVHEQFLISERAAVGLQDKIKSYKRETAERISEISQERGAHTNTLGRLKTALSDIEGELEDFARVLPMLNDIRTLSSIPHRNHSGGPGTVLRASKESPFSKDTAKTTQTSTQGEKSSAPAARDYDAATKEAHRVAEAILRPYRTPPSSRH